MALQVWLPLNGNTNNQGLDGSYTFTNSSQSMITVNSSGKIGKCTEFNSTANNSGIYSVDNGFMDKYINNKSWSLCAWVKTTSTDTCVLSLSYGLRLFAGTSPLISLYNSSRSISCISSVSTTDGNWHHLAVTYNTSNNQIKFYIDGVNTGNNTYTAGYTYASSWSNGLFVGKDPNNSTVTDHYLYKGLMNDVRIYDHALSEKEVKEISKGLVLHYPLNRVNKNLFKYTGLNEFNQELQLNNYNNTGSFTQFGNCLTIDPANYIGTYFTISLDAISPNGTTSLRIYNSNGNPRYFYYSTTLTSSLGNKWEHFSYTFQNTDRGSSYSAGTHPLEVYMPNQMGGKIRNVKIEIGTAETPWTPYTQVDMDTTVYDCSGYKYNGIPIGNLTINSDTPRYDCSISLSGSEQAIQIPNLSILLSDGQFTISVWFRKNTGEWSSLAWETLIGGPSGFELETKNGSSNSPVYYAYSWGAGNVSYTLDTWHLATMTRTSNGTLFYLDGVQKFTGTAGSIPSGNYYIGSWKDSSHQNMRGSVSDFRLYATALSDTDIKELYETGQSIDNKGNIYAYEFKEE